MKLVFGPAAQKGFRRVPVKDAAALLAMFEEIAADPFGPHPQAKKLTEYPGFRVRQGEWRAVYRLDRQANEMLVETVGHRSEVYR